MAHEIVFFGTHEFAATVLQGLLDNPFFKVTLVITQPDRPVGRKKIMTAPPVKVLAESLGIPYLQPTSLKNFALPTISRPEFGIVSQYGNLIPKAVLDWPQKGMLNTHTSLLPKYRGASPVQAALLQGDTETGLTIMLLDEGMDTGPILVQEKISISPDDKYPEVEKKLAEISVPNLIKAIEGLDNGSIKPQTQDDSLASTCGKLDRDNGKVDWQKSATEIYNMYRALYPWPGIWTMWEGKRLKLLEIKPGQESIEPGKVEITNGRIFIGCQNSSIEITELQLEGKIAATSKEFIAGYKRIDQSVLA